MFLKKLPVQNMSAPKNQLISIFQNGDVYYNEKKLFTCRGRQNRIFHKSIDENESLLNETNPFARANVVNHACISDKFAAVAGQRMAMVYDLVTGKLLFSSDPFRNSGNCNTAHQADPILRRNQLMHTCLHTDLNNPDSCFFASSYEGWLQLFDLRVARAKVANYDILVKQGKKPMDFEKKPSHMTSLQDMDVWNQSFGEHHSFKDRSFKCLNYNSTFDLSKAQQDKIVPDTFKKEHITCITQSIKEKHLLALGCSLGTTAIIDIRKIPKFHGNVMEKEGCQGAVIYDQEQMVGTDSDCIVYKYEPASAPITAISFKDEIQPNSPSLLLTASLDKKIRIYDASSRNIVDCLYLGSNTGRVTGIESVRNSVTKCYGMMAEKLCQIRERRTGREQVVK